MALGQSFVPDGGGSGITELTGDVTAGPGSGSQAATIANGAVDIAHLSATGTPSATTFLRGDNTWDTPSGSSLTALYSYWDSYVPDASPHALTDEFTSSSTLTNWTGIYTGDASVVNDIATTLAQGMYFEAPSVTYRIRSRMQSMTALTGDFTVHAAVSLQSRDPSASTEAMVGILLADGTTAAAGKQTGVMAGRNASFYGGEACSGRMAWANYGSDATSAAFDTADYADIVAFIRMRRVSGTYYRAVSADGLTWTEQSFSLLSGLTPTHIGLGFQNYTGQLATAAVRYFRVYTTGTQYRTGALRTVYG